MTSLTRMFTVGFSLYTGEELERYGLPLEVAAVQFDAEVSGARGHA